ncbi:MAG: rRNA maturation RNase YbeY [Acidobacteria bacterium]|nr:MAG: rRNA maturation RNase YbeY [Acidobacteriota bacterium]
MPRRRAPRRSRRAGPQRPAVEVASSVRTGPSARAVASWARRAAAAAGARGAVSVLLCGDGRMRSLNRRWRGLDRPTDVLSFPAGEPGFLGDVVVDVPYAARQAGRLGHGLDREVQVLLVHGVLHLMGHDHETDDGTMFRLQRCVVARAFGPGPDGVPGDGPGPGGRPGR